MVDYDDQISIDGRLVTAKLLPKGFELHICPLSSDITAAMDKVAELHISFRRATSRDMAI